MDPQKSEAAAAGGGLYPAETASREFEDFIYLVSHDVRNSVRALLELPQWIEEDLLTSGNPVSGSLAENIALMNTHTRRLDRMLIDLLIYSRIGRLQQDKTVEWAMVIDAILGQLRIPPGFRILRDIRAPSIRMGETDVITLLSSLVSNSVKHHDRDRGTIRITTRNEGPWQVLSVADDGPGIPREYRDRVFGVMTTLRPRDEIEGSGMGLANVRKITSLYGGRIEWPDQPDQRGCHLVLRFPLNRPPLH